MSAVRTSFTLREATRLAGYRTTHMVHYLARHEIVMPSIRANPGRGRRRLYSFADVVLLKALNRLLAQGIAVRRLRKVQHIYRRLHRGRPESALPARFLITDGVKVFYKENPSAIIDLTDEGQLTFAFVIDMAVINKEICEGAEKLQENSRSRTQRKARK